MGDDPFGDRMVIIIAHFPFYSTIVSALTSRIKFHDQYTEFSTMLPEGKPAPIPYPFPDEHRPYSSKLLAGKGFTSRKRNAARQRPPCSIPFSDLSLKCGTWE
jgi:hypothetical protein